MRQPWLEAQTSPLPDDFSPRSATRRAGAAAWVVGLALLVFAAGRSGAMLDAAYGLPLVPGTEALIALAEAWDAAMAALGIPNLVEAVAAALGTGR